jgi:UDP-glucose:(heptosyl)LPS alpha-1,3-glucosyltransferase
MHLAASQGTPRPFFIIVAGNGKMRKYLRLAKKLDPITAERKIYFLGHVMHIQNVLSISDVAVLPTFYDPCSRYILEALAAGVPVITTSFNGATDLFVDNRHGKVIDTPENVPALAEAIRYFTITENIQAASRAIAADNLKEKISISRVAKQLMDVYEKIQKSKCKM